MATIESEDEGALVEFWDNPVPLMTRRLYEALKAAGVSNIDAYRAQINEPSKQLVHENYVAFNLVGKIAAADLAKSEFDKSQPDRMVAMDFDSVVIDPEATRGALMFRLAESVNAIVVHEKVKRHLEEAGFDTLTFIPPEEWAG